MTHFTRAALKGAAAVALGFSAIAATSAFAQAPDNEATRAMAAQICQSVIRVQRGESEFEGCVSSLATSLQNVSRTRTATQARDACFARNSGSGGTALNLCLLEAAAPRSDVEAIPDAASVLGGVADDPLFARSWFAVTPDTKFRREQQACARLGFDPALHAFAQCVADLASTLQDNETAGD